MSRAGPLALLAPGVLLLLLAFCFPAIQLLASGFMVESEAGPRLGLDHYARLVVDDFYLFVAWRTVKLALIITFLCALIGFPVAYAMARARPALRLAITVILILPLMTSVVVRTFGWLVILGRGGPVSSFLMLLGLGPREATLMHTETGVVLAMVQVLLPFMALTILGVLVRLDTDLEQAARTMGAGFLAALRHVVLPLARPGIVSGSLLVFALSISSFITPGLVGGVRLPVLAGTIYQQITGTLDWPFAAAQAMVLLVGTLCLIVPYLAISQRREG